MDLSLNEQQLMLQSSVRGLVDREFPKAELVDVDAGRAPITGAAWASLVSTGLLGSLIPEELGGAGGSLMDTGVVFEELGRGPVPGPHFSTAVLAALTILEGGTPEQQRALLPAIADGTRVFAVAVTEEDYGWSPEQVHTTARATGGGYLLSGTKLFVHDAADASDLVVAARLQPGHVGLFLVEAKAVGVAIRPIAGFATGLTEVRLDDVRVDGDALLDPGAQVGWAALDRVLPRAAALLAAYQVGGLARVFDVSLAYSQTRRQFQQPIGRFQRVQDHVIDIVNDLDAARWTTYEALWKLDTGKDDAAAAAHMAAAVASEAYYLGCNSAHDVHAGVGIMREYGLTLHTKMSRTLYHYLGDPRHHRRKLALALAL